MKKYLYILGAVVILGVLIYIGYLKNKNEKLQEENIINSQNIKAYEDSLRTYVLSNSELLYAKESFLLNEEQMKQKLEENDIKLKELKKLINSTPTSITQIETAYVRDTILIAKKDSASFEYNDDWLKMKGEMNDSTVKIYDVNVPVPVVVGQTEDMQVFVTSKNPYINVTDIENNILYVKQKSKKNHWGIGVSVGPGVYYGFTSKKIEVGVGVGIGVHYNF